MTSITITVVVLLQITFVFTSMLESENPQGNLILSCFCLAMIDYVGLCLKFKYNFGKIKT